MVDQALFDNQDDLAIWLSKQPRDQVVMFAVRSAARVLPIWASYCLRNVVSEEGPASLPILRVVLASSVAAMAPGREVTEAIAAATSAVAVAAHLVADDARAASAVAAAASNGVSTKAIPAAVGAALAQTAATRAADAAAANATAESSNAAAAAAVAATARGGAHFVAAAANVAASRAAVIDAATDLDAIERGISLSLRPLWSAPSPMLHVWKDIRANWSQPNSPYAFWLRWYESLLDPASHPPFPPELLREIALIPNEVWEKGAEAVAGEIARIETAFERRTPDLATVLRDLPPASSGAVEATRQAMQRHRADLPPTFDAILSFIALEINRLQTRNYDPDPEETTRQIRTLRTLFVAVEKLQTLVPQSEIMPEVDAERAEKLARLYINKFREWPREHAGEMVDNTFRLGLAGLTGFLLPMIGVPPVVALGAGMIVFGNKDFAEKAKVATGLLPKSGGG